MKTSLAVLMVSLIALVIVLGPSKAVCQTSEVRRTVVVSTNFILDFFEWYNGEVEVRLGTSHGIGVAGSYYKFGSDEDEDDEIDSNKGGQFFYRYYPQAQATAGFYVGGRIGVYEATGTSEGLKETGTYYGVGMDIGYSWLFGEPKRVYLSTGLGVVRMFGGDLDDVTVTLPTIRVVNLGIAF